MGRHEFILAWREELLSAAAAVGKLVSGRGVADHELL
jgi:hypothetical protein